MAIDYSQYGASQEPDYSKYGAVPEQQTLQSQQMPGYERYPLDVLAGVATAGQGLHNTPYNITNLISSHAAANLPDFLKPTNIDFGSEFGIKDPSFIDKLLQGTGQFAPYALGGEAALATKIPSMLARSSLEGAAYGGTQSDNPLTGALLGSAGGLAGGVVGKAAGAIPGGFSAAKNYISNNALAKEAPDALNEMASGISDRSNAPLFLKDKLANLYKSNQTQAKQFASPLNKADISFPIADQKTAFPGYMSAAKPLLENRDSLNDLFGSSSSLGTKLNKELDIANTFLGNVNKGKPSVILNDSGQPYKFNPTTADFQDIWGRLKDLGAMQAKAAKMGARNESRMIGDLRSGLADDLKTNLSSTGNDELAQKFTQFNNFYKYKVAPIFENSIISKAAQVPRNVPAGSSLAQALHKPSINSRLVFDQLDPDTKNAAAYQLITGGKGTSEGTSTMSPQEIGKSYSKFGSDVKATIASHNPKADAMFQTLANMFGKNDSSQTLSQALLNKIPVVGPKISATYPFIANQQASPLSQGLQGLFRNPLTPIAINHFGGNQ